MSRLTRNKPASKSARASAPRPSGPHQIRIIGGQWKRTPLAVLDAQGLRPTPDRVRETLFNWLHHVLEGRWEQASCLDLFAGTGALGFEAASRGAERVVMVEANAAAVRQLEATIAKLRAGQQIAIQRGDALSVAERLALQAENQGTRFDVIFLDPPYHQGWLEKMLPLCQRLLKQHGVVYAELEQPLSMEHGPDWLEGWEVVRADKAGMVFYHVLQRKMEPEFQA